MDRLEKMKKQIAVKEYSGSLIPGINQTHGGTVTLKALREKAYVPTLYRDYVSEILYTRYRKASAERLTQYVTAGGVSQTQSISNASELTVNAIRRWCEPDCLFSKVSGMPMLPIPQNAVAKSEPQQVWQRYAQAAQLAGRAEDIIYCVKKVLELAPQEFGKQNALKEKLLDKIAGYPKGAKLADYLKTMQELYPNDYRTHYVYLRQLTGEFKPPKTFKSFYDALNYRLSQLKKKDAQELLKLQEQYKKLQQEILEYMQPFAQAEEAHGNPICFGCLAGDVPQKDFYMRNDWLTWWQPLKDENDQILRKIGEDLQKITEKSQKGFSLFGR